MAGTNIQQPPQQADLTGVEELVVGAKLQGPEFGIKHRVRFGHW